jgi:E1A/CREB-binding protein
MEAPQVHKAGAQSQQEQVQQPAAQRQLQQQDAQAAQGHTNMGPEKKKQCIHASKVWLLFMWHCARCDQDNAGCRYGHSCAVGKDLWTHMLECRLPQCDHPHCAATRKLLKHHMKCQVGYLTARPART